MLFGKVPFAETGKALFAEISGDESKEPIGESWVEYCSPSRIWTEPKEDVRNIIRCQDGT